MFSFRPDWHQDNRASPLVRQYQTTLDSVLESQPELQSCVVHCVHCAIRFLTHPRNAGRRNLRCPFGCRAHRRRECARRRSAAYYDTVEGRRKKKRLNGRRSGGGGSQAREPTENDTEPERKPADRSPSEPHPTELPVPPMELRLEELVLDEASVVTSRMLPYARMIVSLIERVHFSLEELVDLLRQALRQHSMAHRKRSDYVLTFLHRHPP